MSEALSLDGLIGLRRTLRGLTPDAPGTEEVVIYVLDTLLGHMIEAEIGAEK